MQTFKLHNQAKVKNLLFRLRMLSCIIKPVTPQPHTQPLIVVALPVLKNPKAKPFNDRLNKCFNDELEYFNLQIRMAKKVSKLQEKGIIKEVPINYNPSFTTPWPKAKAGFMDRIGPIVETTYNAPHTFKRTIENPIL